MAGGGTPGEGGAHRGRAWRRPGGDSVARAGAVGCHAGTRASHGEPPPRSTRGRGDPTHTRHAIAMVGGGGGRGRAEERSMTGGAGPPRPLPIPRAIGWRACRHGAVSAPREARSTLILGGRRGRVGGCAPLRRGEGGAGGLAVFFYFSATVRANRAPGGRGLREGGSRARQELRPAPVYMENPIQLDCASGMRGRYLRDKP